MKRLTILFAIMAMAIVVCAQPKKDKAVFKEYKPGFYQNNILKGIEEFQNKEEKPKVDRRFKIDLSGADLPNNIDLYTKQWYNEPISQGNTGTCWCFSTTSFFETEVYRLSKQKVKLSEMYTVYWEYVEKARRFIQERGNSAFGEGSEANAVTRIWKKYGVVPASVYTGMMPGQTYHSHEKMFEEMNGYLQGLKQSNNWNEEAGIATIKSILNHYMGEPPVKFFAESKEYAPQDYLVNVLKLKLDDYIDVTSIMAKPYWEKVEYEVTDNWWHSADYYNLPLDDYMKVVKAAIRAGYTLGIGGDVSEPGFETSTQVAVVPSFDIPSEYIDENARQMRFGNQTTTDDHGIHLVGFYVKDGKDWYLIKDSGSGSRNNGKDSKNFGHYFFSEDYVKLKMMDFIVHKDMLKDYLPKFK